MSCDNCTCDTKKEDDAQEKDYWKRSEALEKAVTVIQNSYANSLPYSEKADKIVAVAETFYKFLKVK